MEESHSNVYTWQEQFENIFLYWTLVEESITKVLQKHFPKYP